MIFILMVISIICVETKIKSYIETNKEYGKQEKIFKGKIIINKHHNYGMILDSFKEKKEWIIAITSTCLGGLIAIFAVTLSKKKKFFLKLGLSMMLGGAASNVYDRIKKGYVVDYLSFNKGKKLKKIVFNLADIFIFIGSLITAIASSFEK